jgi:hypothetical protein
MIPFYICKNKHILHGNDIDYNVYKHIMFKKFDFRFPKNSDERKYFCKLFSVNHLIHRLNTKYGNMIKNACAVHVRRTDFANFHNGRFLRTSNQIINLIDTYYHIHNVNTFIIFSDDINWCKTNI